MRLAADVFQGAEFGFSRVKCHAAALNDILEAQAARPFLLAGQHAAGR